MIDHRSGEEPGEPPIRFRDYAPEDSIVLVVFWILAGLVFAQFFSRYVLNSAIAWAEEIARYLLIGVGFLGSVIAVRKRSHIYVEVFYRLLPKWAGKTLSRVVDIITVAFFAVASTLSIRVIPIMSRQRMVSVDVPLSVVYWVVTVSFTIMTLRSVQIAWRHRRDGYVPVAGEGNDA